MKKLFVIVVVLALLASGLYVSGYGQKWAGAAFFAYNAPAGEFDPTAAVAAPDYAKVTNWAALPSVSNPADLVPTGIHVLAQGEHGVDTFFIHPTGLLVNSSWVSTMDPNTGTEENTKWMMANQASAFNGCCNIYAPRYREANIAAYFGEQAQRDRLLAFSYEDVRRAFDYFITHQNQGRPFIIASHSQGSHHAKRLLTEVVDASPLHQRMVAAYLIGAVLIPMSPGWLDSMANIAACQNANDLHCVVHWDTMPEGAPVYERGEPSLCTNPLTWRVDETRAEAALNEGAVVPEGTYNTAFGRAEDVATGQTFTKLAAPVAQHTWAKCTNGTLFVGLQDGTEFKAMGSDGLGSYHGLDYALFYMNIHNNAKLRAATFLQLPSAN